MNIKIEQILLKILETDKGRLSKFAADWIEEYCSAGECQLAYDTFIHEIEKGSYIPSKDTTENFRLLSGIFDTGKKSSL